MIFESERQDMRPVALSQLSKYYPEHAFFTEYSFREEGSKGMYRADLVLIQYDYDALQGWVDETGPATSAPKGTTYFQLKELAPIDFEDWRQYVESKLGEPYYAYSEAGDLEEMIDDGYIENDDGTLRLVDFPRDIIQYVIGIEMKRHDLGKAVEQAERYAEQFANRAFVMVDGDREGAVLKRREMFRDAGVGLMSLDRERLETVLPPKKYHRHPDWSPKRLCYNMYDMYMEREMQGRVEQDIQSFEDEISGILDG